MEPIVNTDQAQADPESFSTNASTGDPTPPDDPDNDVSSFWLVDKIVSAINKLNVKNGGVKLSIKGEIGGPTAILIALAVLALVLGHHAVAVLIDHYIGCLRP